MKRLIPLLIILPAATSPARHQRLRRRRILRRRALLGAVVRGHLVCRRSIDRAVHAAVGLRDHSDRRLVDSRAPIHAPACPRTTCKQHAICQASYTGSATVRRRRGRRLSSTPPSPSAGTYRSCRAIPQPVDPCKALDAAACQTRQPLRDSAARAAAAATAFPTERPCDCTTPHRPPLRRSSSAASSPAPTRATRAPTARPAAGSRAGPRRHRRHRGGSTSGGTAQPASAPATAASSVGGSFGADEATAYKQHDCVPSTTIGTASCELRRRKTSRIHCADDSRLRHRRSLRQRRRLRRRRAAPARTKPSATPTCTASRSTRSIARPTPTAPPAASRTDARERRQRRRSVNGAPRARQGAGAAEAAAVRAELHAPASTPAGGCDAGKSVLVRDPAILDDPFWALPRVLGRRHRRRRQRRRRRLAGAARHARRPSSGQTAAARTGAAAFIAALPRRSDGVHRRLAARLRADVAVEPPRSRRRHQLRRGAHHLRARDRRRRLAPSHDRHRRAAPAVRRRALPHRRADVDRACRSSRARRCSRRCRRFTCRFLTPANLKQIRTNEFLVGPQDPSQPPSAWELREFHLGTDARLHQSLLPLQIDPTAVDVVARLSDLGAGQPGRRSQRGTVDLPAQYQVPTGSEDGTQCPLSRCQRRRTS